MSTPNTIRGNIIQLSKLVAPYLKGHKLSLSIVTFGLLLQIILTAILPISYKYLFDEVTKNILHQWVIIGLILFMIIVLIYGSWSDYVLAKMGTDICNTMQFNIQHNIDNMPFDYFNNATVVTKVITNFNVDIRNVGNFIIRILPLIVSNSVQTVVSYAIMFFFSPYLALLMLFIIPLAGGLSGALLPKIQNEERKKDLAEITLTNHLRESMLMHAVISAFNLQDFWEKQFHAKVIRYTKLDTTVKFLKQLVDRINIASSNFLELSIVAIGVLAVIYGYITVGTWIGFFILAQTIIRSISRLSNVYSLLPESLRTAERLTAFFNQTTKYKQTTGNIIVQPFNDQIRFEDVSFGYTEDTLNLENVSFNINRGESVAFVGSSGSGKSTVLALLLHFYSPTKGDISIDNHSYSKIDTASFRQQVSVIMQDTRLFDMSIRDNIRMGKLDASEEEIIAAAQAAELHDEICAFPQGYDTILTDQGNNLSGGQRQRVAIARALLRNPRILFGDEITAALDPATEIAINQTLLKYAKYCTYVYVTHHLKSVVDVDRIFVMEQGHLVESGTHEELLALKGIYYELWTKQNSINLSTDAQSTQVSLELLHKIPLLQTLEESTLKKFANRLVMESYEENHLIFKQGVPGDKFYIIVRGSVEIKKQDSNGIEQRVAILEEGDHFGEIALIKNIPRTKSAYTITPCIFLTLSRTKFFQIFNKSAKLREELKKLMQSRYEEN